MDVVLTMLLQRRNRDFKFKSSTQRRHYNVKFTTLWQKLSQCGIVISPLMDVVMETSIQR